MHIGINLSNRQWIEPQLTDGDRQLLLQMLPGLTSVLLFSYHKLGVWQWARDNLHPSCYVVRLNNEGDLPLLKGVYDAGYRNVVVQLGNEPNHPHEPWGGDIGSYCRWAHGMVNWLRANCPQWKLCSGALSPAFSYTAWLNDDNYHTVVNRCDYLGAHGYYQQDWRLSLAPITEAHRVYPNKEVFVTEVCCTAGEGGVPRPRATLAVEYPLIARELGRMGWVKGVYYFILDSGDRHWVDVGETFDGGMARAIAAIRLEAPTVALEFKLAFAEWAREHPEVGKPTSDICYYPNSNPEGQQMIVQWAEHAKLEYNQAEGKVHPFPF